MRNLIPSFLLISLLAGSSVASNSIPEWIQKGPLSDASHHYVVCSHDGLDPEDIRQVAESKCLASAAKLGGVVVSVREKTVQSLSGSDASEVAEIEPLKRDVKCTWTGRYLEKLPSGFRIWLRCRLSKASVTKAPTRSMDSKDSLASKPPTYKRATITITTVPKADKIIVHGLAGERVIDPTGNVTQIELKEGDEKIVARKQKYRDQERAIKLWKHGDSISETIYLEQEI